MSGIEIYPEERNKLVSIWAALQQKWMGKPDDLLTLTSFANEAQDKIRNEVGLIVSIDIGNKELMDDGTLVTSPVVSVIGRVEAEKEHDHERHAFEVQSGAYDGREGVMGKDGKLKDSKRKIV